MRKWQISNQPCLGTMTACVSKGSEGNSTNQEVLKEGHLLNLKRSLSQLDREVNLGDSSQQGRHDHGSIAHWEVEMRLLCEQRALSKDCDDRTTMTNRLCM
jgi:hypothetical protein